MVACYAAAGRTGDAVTVAETVNHAPQPWPGAETTAAGDAKLLPEIRTAGCHMLTRF
jgi:hypothetical protein